MLKTQLSDCTGCGVCALVCPKNCITMVENSLGFVEPRVDAKNCISCNLCNKKCHTNLSLAPFFSEKAYAAWANNEQIRVNGSSGGVFYSIASKFIIDGGFVAAAVLDDMFNLKHMLASTQDDLLKMQKSKYFQSDMNEIYPEIMKLLNDKRKVLFVGTPCQVGAIKTYIPHKLQVNLFTIDIMCHGVPSKKMFQSHLNSLEKKHSKKIRQIEFRSKDNPEGWKDSCRLVSTFTDGSVINASSKVDFYWRAFLANISLRDSCYKCHYSGRERVGDITIGDYWGIGRKYPIEFDPHNGVSAIFINSQRAERLIDSAELVMYERNADEVIENNFSLTGAAQKAKGFAIFRKCYPRFEFDRAVLLSTLSDIIGDKCKAILGDNLTAYIRKAKHKILRRDK